VSGAEFDDDVTVDADEALLLLAQIRAEAARRAAASGDDGGSGDAGEVPESADGATQEVGEEVLESLRAGQYEEDVAIVEGYGALREIGRGGFSRVYEALQFEFQRWVAIKVLNETLESDEKIAEFERECRLMGVLSHPNIVTVFASAFTSDSRPCIVMELFPHGSYLNILQRFGPLGLEELLSLAVQMSGALATTHRQGVVHGDVKPQNIFRSEFGSAALGDFGIATLMHQRAVAAKTRLSLYYAAPELIEHGVSATSPFADQYSLAATIYTLATGLRPFATETGGTTEQMLSRMLSEPAPRLGGEFPQSLDDALWQAMAREPQDRHRDVVAFAAAIAKVEQQLGLKPTEIPISRDGGRYVGQTPELDRPRSTAAPRSQDSPITPPLRTGDRHPGAVSEERMAGVDSRTVLHPTTPADTGSPEPEPEQPQEEPRVPLWAMIGWAVAAVAAAITILLLIVPGRNVEESVESYATVDGGGSGVEGDPQSDGKAPLAEEEVSRNNDYSEGDAIEVTVPEAPDDIVVRERDRRLVVTWGEPHDGGSAILGYRVEIHSDGAKQSELSRSPDERNAEFTGLVNGKTYEVHLVAENEAGPSDPAQETGVPNVDRVRIAFTSSYEGQEAIYYLDVAYGPALDDMMVLDITRVTESDRREKERSPSWASDGSWIAFERRTNSNTHWQVIAKEIGSRTEKQLFCGNENGWSASWSPDGTQIAFARGRSGENDLFSIDLSTGQLEVLKDEAGATDAYPSWSPDGRHIAFVRGSQPRRDIRVLHVGSETMHVDILVEGGGDSTTPRWSPDGEQIAYAFQMTDSPYRHIYRINWDERDPKDSTPEPVTDGRYYDTEPSWSHDGRFIVFARGNEGSRDLYVVSSAGGEPIPLLEHTAYDYWAPSWSPITDVSVDPTFDCEKE